MGSHKPIGTIKKEWSDFQVMESGLQLGFTTALYGPEGTFTRFALTKRGVENDVALREVARQLDVRPDAVSSCGRKDSFAETVQEVVVAGNFSPTFTHARIWLRQLGPAARPLVFGGHKGNTFVIKVYTDHTERLTGVQFKNYFGHQRFGGSNPLAGRYLLEGEYAKAFDALEGTREQRYRDLRFALKQNGRQLSKEEVMAHRDMVEVAKRCIQGWQSHLWNVLASKTQASSHRHELPAWTEATADLYNEWWDPERLQDDMLALARPLIRPLYVVAKNLQSYREPDGWRYRFTLRPGAFATVFLASHYDLRDASVEAFNARKEAQRAST